MIRDSFSSISTEVESISGHHDLAFNAGDIIVTCRPYIHIISDSMQGKLCDLCLRPTQTSYLHDCPECQQISFCNSCNESSRPSIFKTIHNLECNLLNKYGKILTSSSRFFLRLYLRLKNPESIQYQNYINPLTKEEINFESLIPNIIFEDDNEADALCNHIELCYEKYNSDDELKNTKDATVIDIAILQFINLLEQLRLCEDLKNLISNDYQIYELWKIFVRLWSYTVPIYDETVTGLFSKDPVAYGLYLEPSVIIESHSCVPNCSFANYGPVIQLRAMRPIEMNEGLTVNFVDITQPKEERINELQNYYIRNCLCSRCVTQDDDSIDMEKFHCLNNEFITLFNEDFMFVPSKNRSLLNFSTSNEDLDIQNYYKKCINICYLARKLNNYYEQIYLFNHPNKSRFLFAYTAVEMNLLFFKLEFRDTLNNDNNNNNSIIENNSLNNNSSKRESGSITTLDSIIMDINNWSNLLKRTVKNIRWTHGTDHRLYREMALPLINIWNEAFGGKKLTLDQLYSDPGILLNILGCVNRSQANDFIEHSNFLKGYFSRPLSTESKTNSKSLSSFDFLKICFRFLLVIFALIFPFYIYFSLYIQPNHFY